jgi:hypothetical protein
LKPG